MRASFYIVVCSGCTALGQGSCRQKRPIKKRPTEVGRLDIGAWVRSPVYAPGNDL